MNQLREDEYINTIKTLQSENKYHIERCEFWKERFEEADKEILKVGASTLIIGIFMGVVIGNTIIGWLG